MLLGIVHQSLPTYRHLLLETCGAITSKPAGTIKVLGREGVQAAVRFSLRTRFLWWRSEGLVSRMHCGTCARTYYEDVL